MRTAEIKEKILNGEIDDTFLEMYQKKERIKSQRKRYYGAVEKQESYSYNISIENKKV